MPNIVLNKSKINYHYTDGEGLFIVSGVIDSSCSYESPKIIRSKMELDIYFGDSFKERDYFEELLDSGIFLLLYKPISKELREFEELPEKTETYLCESEFPKSGKEDILYIDSYTDNNYVWNNDLSEYINVKDLPKNLYSLDNYESWYNRDTLRICSGEEININKKTKIQNTILYCHPRYQTEYPLKINKNIELIKEFNNYPGYFEKVMSQDRALAYHLDLSKVSSFSGKDGLSGYLCFSIVGDKDHKALIWFNGGNDKIPLAGDIILIENSYEIKYSPENFDKKEIITRIISIFKECGYSVKEYENEFSFIIYSESNSILNIGFTNIENIDFSLNQTLSQDILSQVSEDYKRIEFYSKTIGPSRENIKVKIEEITNYVQRYRITLSRFNYVESFDVNLFDIPDRDGEIQSLDNIINRGSNLVTCKLFREKSNGSEWKPDDVGAGLPIGEWELKGSHKELANSEMYWEAIHALKEIEVKEDFLCIPEIEYYLKFEKDYEDIGYFPEYLDLLKYSEEKNCQVLIGNLNFGVTEDYPGINEDPVERMIYKSGDNYEIFWEGEYKKLNLKEDNKILKWKNTFIYNYNKDYDNRLVYFYRDMSLGGYYYRPPYYIFLKGLVTGNYSSTSNSIRYTSPVLNPFIFEDFERMFEFKKTNYMVYDNQKYFYKNFQNHPGDNIYNMTILTRFSISKVSRTLQNNKWRFLGKQMKSSVRASIQGVLNYLSSTFDVYKNISLVDFQMDYITKSLTINLKLYLKELVDKPINLDVELNYIY